MSVKFRIGPIHKKPYETWKQFVIRVRDHLEKYGGFDDHGGFEVYTGKRVFEWKQSADCSPGDLSTWTNLAVQILKVYAYHIEAHQLGALHAETDYYAMVYPHVKRTENDIKSLIEMVFSVNRKQVGPFNRMLKDLSEGEALLKSLMIDNFKSKAVERWELEAARTEKDALPNLELGLSRLFGKMTNLTRAVQAVHITNLLTHFEIISEDKTYEMDYVGALERRLFNDRRSSTEKREMERGLKAEAKRQEHFELWSLKTSLLRLLSQILEKRRQ